MILVATYKKLYIGIICSKKEYPLDMKSKDLKIDTMNCTLSTLVMNGMIETEMKEYLGTGAAP